MRPTLWMVLVVDLVLTLVVLAMGRQLALPHGADGQPSAIASSLVVSVQMVEVAVVWMSTALVLLLAAFVALRRPPRPWALLTAACVAQAAPPTLVLMRWA